jgi:hypothetical protein
MVAQGLTDKVTNDKLVTFYFPSCGTIPPPVIMVQVNNNKILTIQLIIILTHLLLFIYN